MTAARSRNVFANGLEHHVLEWDAGASPARTAVLLHGFADAGGSWTSIAGGAAGLVAAGLRVLAPDLRGFGRSPRAPDGAYYHFADYVADVMGIVDAEIGAAPFLLAGHSMGGTVATYLAGTMPERILRLALLEGLGPPDNPMETAPDRMRRWLDDLRALQPKRATQKPIAREDALRRLAANHTGVDLEVLRAQLEHLVADAGDGLVTWRADPLHKSISPSPFYARHFSAFCKRITCPVLSISGGPTGFHPADEGERLACFPAATHVEIEGAGHMMHWTRPAEVTRLLADFFTAV